MKQKKYEYYIEFLNENGDADSYETVAENDEEAVKNFEDETGYDESDLTDCKRSAV